jgi:ElaB/YqjD/DUF883 family membrane-anchored ribosome-binding protein
MKESNNMDKQRQAIHSDLGALAEDARGLMATTVDVAGEKVGEARKRLANELSRFRDTVVEGTKATNHAVRENPYQAIGIAAGVGALIGFLIARQCSRDA